MKTSGIINIDKPGGITSHGCVQTIRKLTGLKRVGHTGTLDPQATGVLPVCIGSAARVMEYLDLDFKKYRCGMMLGLVTDTQDVWGKVISDSREKLKGGAVISRAGIEGAFASFKGLIEQSPPIYSAIRVNGKRLYEYARAGEDVEIKKRKVFIEDISITDIDLDNLKISFDVVCSKGTYVRAICHEAGEKLGCGGAMSSLTRLASGAFKIEDAVSLDDLARKNEEEIDRLIAPADYPLIHFGRATVKNPEIMERFVNGGIIEVNETYIEAMPEFAETDPPFNFREAYKRAYNIYAGAERAGVFLGVAFLNDQGVFAVDKIFFRRTGQ